jgi:HSP20 family protein
MQSTANSPAKRATPVLVPPVDIVEDAAGITLLADLPGVDRKDLSIGVDGRTLTIEAPLGLGEANALVSLHAEVRANRYRRSFELSGELDTNAIDAGLKDGVLTLRIPKLERAKPRRIEVRVE